MKMSVNKAALAVVALAIMVGVVPTLASAVVIGPDNTAVNFKLSGGPSWRFTVSGAITISCTTHTWNVTTGRASDRLTIPAANNNLSEGFPRTFLCPSDQRGVTASMVVSSAWQLTATRTTGMTMDLPDNAMRITLNGGIFGGCNSQIQRSSITYTYTAPRLTSDPRNTVNTRGSGGFCVFGTAATIQETLTVNPPITIR